MKFWIKFLIIFNFLFFSLSNLNSLVVASSENEAILTLNKAEESLASIYTILNEAEANGADISGLSKLLNDATQLLAQAHNALKIKDYDKTENFANLAWEIGNDLQGPALSLREIKIGSPTEEIWNTVSRTIMTAILIIVATLLFWNLFKRIYYRRISLMKPQVTNFEH